MSTRVHTSETRPGRKTTARDRLTALFLRPAYLINRYFFYFNRLRFATSKGVMNAATRDLDPADTSSWEYSAFSQNGEDGIIDQLATLINEPNHYFIDAHPSLLYYGVSLAGWQNFFGDQGYEFVTVDFNGVNAFFVDPEAVESGALQGIKRIDWQENCSQRARFHCDWNQQYNLISDMPFEMIPG